MSKKSFLRVKKRTMSFLLVALMVFSLLPVNTVFAAEYTYEKVSVKAGSVTADSEESPAQGGDGGAGYAFDNNLGTQWHTKYTAPDADDKTMPHWISWELSEPTTIGKIDYVGKPGANGVGNGVFKAIDIYVSEDANTAPNGSGSGWSKVYTNNNITYSPDRGTETKREASFVFDSPVEAAKVLIVVRESYSVDDDPDGINTFANATELITYKATLVEPEPEPSDTLAIKVMIDGKSYEGASLQEIVENNAISTSSVRSFSVVGGNIEFEDMTYLDGGSYFHFRDITSLEIDLTKATMYDENGNVTTALPDGSFGSMQQLKELRLPGVTEIGYSNFTHAGNRGSGISVLEIPDVKVIGNRAFQSAKFATSLKNLDLSGVQTIGDQAFDCNNYFKTINLSSIVTLGDEVFDAEISSLTLPASLVSVGHNAVIISDGGKVTFEGDVPPETPATSGWYPFGDNSYTVKAPSADYKSVKFGANNNENITFDVPETPEVVDKTALKELIDETARYKTATPYTEESWAAFESAKEAANAVYESEDATQAEVTDAYNNLKTAFDGLERVEVNGTISLVVGDEVISLNEVFSRFGIPGTYGEPYIYDKALSSNPIIRIEGTDITQVEIKTDANNTTNSWKVTDGWNKREMDLFTAYNYGENTYKITVKIDGKVWYGSVEITNYTLPSIDELKAKIEEAKTYSADDYSEESYAVLQEAIESAELTVTLNKNMWDSDQSHFDAKVELLNDAIAQLEESVTIVDKTALKEAIDKADTAISNTEHFTHVTQGLEEAKAALQKAQGVYENEAATQEEVDDMVKELDAAILNMKAHELLVEIIAVDSVGDDSVTLEVNERPYGVYAYEDSGKSATITMTKTSDENKYYVTADHLKSGENYFYVTFQELWNVDENGNFAVDHTNNFWVYVNTETKEADFGKVNPVKEPTLVLHVGEEDVIITSTDNYSQVVEVPEGTTELSATLSGEDLYRVYVALAGTEAQDPVYASHDRKTIDFNIHDPNGELTEGNYTINIKAGWNGFLGVDGTIDETHRTTKYRGFELRFVEALTDKTELQALYDEVKDYVSDDGYYDEFEEALLAASDVLAKEDATQEEVDNAYSELELYYYRSLAYALAAPYKPVGASSGQWDGTFDYAKYEAEGALKVLNAYYGVMNLGNYAEASEVKDAYNALKAAVPELKEAGDEPRSILVGPNDDLINVIESRGYFIFTETPSEDGKINLHIEYVNDGISPLNGKDFGEFLGRKFTAQKSTVRLEYVTYDGVSGNINFKDDITLIGGSGATHVDGFEADVIVEPGRYNVYMELEGVEVYSQGYYYTANAAVDKSYLQDLYDEASVYARDDVKGYKELQERLANSKDVLDDNAATQEEVDKEVIQLEGRYRYVLMQELSHDNQDKVYSKNYTTESLKPLVEVDKAVSSRNVYSKYNVMKQEDIDTIKEWTAKYEKALAGLVLADETTEEVGINEEGLVVTSRNDEPQGEFKILSKKTIADGYELVIEFTNSGHHPVYGESYTNYNGSETAFGKFGGTANAKLYVDTYKEDMSPIGQEVVNSSEFVALEGNTSKTPGFTVRITVPKDAELLTVDYVYNGDHAYSAGYWAVDALEDTTAPTVTLKDFRGKVLTLNDEGMTWFNFDVYGYVKDDNLVSFKLDGEDYEAGTKVWERTKHQFTAEDLAGNTTVVNFGIDKARPEVTGVANGETYDKEVTPVIKDKELSGLKEVTLNGETYVSGTPISEDGEYTLVAYDNAGNKTTVSFKIHKDDKAPVIKVDSCDCPHADEGIHNHSIGYSVSDDSDVTVIVNGSPITLQDGRDWISVSEGQAFTKEIEAIDEYGNTTKLTLYFDAKAPTITLDPQEMKVKVGKTADLDSVNVVVEDNLKGATWTRSTDEIDTSKAQIVKVVYTAQDKAGNTAEATLVVKVVTGIANYLLYDANGGEGGPVNNFSNGTTITVRTTTPTRAGYNFMGWNTEKDGSGTAYQPGDTILIDPDGLGGKKVTLYAQWERKVANTLWLDTNGGNEGIWTSYTNATTINIRTAVPTRDGYVFKEWNTEKDGTGTAYDPGDLVNIDPTGHGGVTYKLYAQWNEVFTVTYTDPSGSFEDQVYEVEKGDNVPAFEGTPTRDGWAFSTWNRDYKNGEQTKETVTEDCLFKAFWTNLPADLTVEDATAHGAVRVTDYLRPNSSFDFNADGGHNKAPKLVEGTFTVNETVYDAENMKVTASVTITDPQAYAQFLQEVYDQYYSDGGKYIFREDLTPEENLTVHLTIRGTYAGAPGSGSRPGNLELTFDTPWIMDTDYTGGQKRPQLLFSRSYDVVLDDGSDSRAAYIAHLVETSPGVFTLGNIEDPVREGYKFLGWNTAEDGSGTTYHSGDTIEIEPGDTPFELKLYAMWEIDIVDTITITPEDLSAYTGGESLNANSFPNMRYRFTVSGDVDLSDGITLYESEDSLDEELAKVDVEGPSVFALLARTFTARASEDVVTEPTLIPELTPEFTYDLDASNSDYEGEVNPSENDQYAGVYKVNISNGDELIAKIDGQYYDVEIEESNVLIRYVSDPEAILDSNEEFMRSVVNDEPTSEVSEAVAVVDPNTTYLTNNDPNMTVINRDAVRLFVDELLPPEQSDGVDRRTEMVAKADEYLKAEGMDMNDRNYVFKYLDLVNTVDGNAWVSSTLGTDIYLPYPENTTMDTDFTLLHFRDLHREYGLSTNEEISDAIKNSTIEEMTIEKTPYGIKFHVDQSGFSPFLLTWTDAKEPAFDMSDVDTTLDLNEKFDPMTGVKVEDAYGNDLSERVVVTSNNVDTSKVGKYEVVYEVSDDYGHTVEVALTFEVVDKTALKELVEDTSKLNKDQYTTDTYDKLEDALNEAKKVLEDDKATQAEIDAAYDALNEALTSLDKVVPAIPNTGIDDNIIFLPFILILLMLFGYYAKRRLS